MAINTRVKGLPLRQNTGGPVGSKSCAMGVFRLYHKSCKSVLHGERKRQRCLISRSSVENSLSLYTKVNSIR